MSDGPSRAENLARLEALKKQLCELEKQYEKEKPLINLVDNMVKLGTLYRGAPGKGKSKSSSGSLHASESATLDRLEFNQRIQERRLLQEEQRQWDRLSPNHTELQVGWRGLGVVGGFEFQVILPSSPRSSSCTRSTSCCRRSPERCRACSATRKIWSVRSVG